MINGYRLGSGYVMPDSMGIHPVVIPDSIGAPPSWIPTYVGMTRGGATAQFAIIFENGYISAAGARTCFLRIQRTPPRQDRA
ncbi:MAG: hypothetical protein ACPL7J_04805, partial [Desulfomonilaceae bacterium]